MFTNDNGKRDGEKENNRHTRTMKEAGKKEIENNRKKHQQRNNEEV